MPQLPIYQIRRLLGVDGEELVIHMVLSKHGDAVELFVGGGTPVVITRHQFEMMTLWVHGQFEELANRPEDTIH